jgi:preprotein translocase subunit SecA
MKLLQKLKSYFRTLRLHPVSRDLEPYQERFEQIQDCRLRLAVLSDQQLQTRARELKSQAAGNDFPDKFVVEIYALVAEAFKRTLGLEPYEVQLLAALALLERNVIEMQTGEGKTVSIVFAACLQALTGKGVHVLTFNDYLAKRDACWMGPVYDFMGISVGYLEEAKSPEEKRLAYDCEVTYTTAKQVGFDYLRSCMAYEPGEIVQRDLYCAIVDEADAILIDEARNPLVLAGNLADYPIDHHTVATYVSGLIQGQDYLLDAYARNVYLTEWGITKTQHHFSVTNLYDRLHHQLHTAINQALQAKALLHRDIDYIIQEEQVKLVDEFTGRVVEDRKWQTGLQAAVEAKEGLPVRSEGSILNSITLQHLMACYEKLSGLTGTASTAAEELASMYEMGVTVIPTHKPVQRIDFPDRIFPNQATKREAIIREVESVHRTGRPILIGTLTVRESEELQAALQRHSIACTVLNARHHEKEAALIEQAGMRGAVTISTHMAGRGTDIRLGGTAAVDREKIRDLGGLHILGTNRHESSRIDFQLRGRAGRQGDPGSSQFILSVEDKLMVKYQLKSLLPKKYRQGWPSDANPDPDLEKAIRQAQRRIEGQLHDQRQTLYRYTSFVETQRKVFLGRRQAVLFSEVAALSVGQSAYILFQYDRLWASYLSEVALIREGIFWERIAGRDPLNQFYRTLHALFQELLVDLDAVHHRLERLGEEDLKIKRPSSIWTYMVNDNPFENQFSMFLRRMASLQF